MKLRIYWLQSLLLLALVAGMTTCGKKNNEDPAPRRQLSLAEREELFAFSEGMRNSSNQYAALTVAYGSLINATYLGAAAFYDIEDNATFQNGCWTWGDQSGIAVRYCTGETSTEFTFNIEVRLAAGAPFVRYYEARERKDGTAGSIRYFDPENGTTVIAILEWQINGPVLSWSYSIPSTNDSISIVYNESTQTGTLQFREAGVLRFESTWNNLTCSGTYNDIANGESGSWTCD
jgi:hypothetical protein